MGKTIDYYLKLPYTIELQHDAEEGWFVRVKELPGCMSQGDTAEEALVMIQDAMQGWLEVALEDGMPIPEPRPEEEYSGKFVVRVPRSLHRELVETAEREGVSLNQYVNVALAGTLHQSSVYSSKSGVIEGPMVAATAKGQIWFDAGTLRSIKGVGEEYADLLKTVGISTELGLAQSSPDTLYQKVVAVNREKKLVRKLPTIEQLSNWIEEAKQLSKASVLDRTAVP